MRKIKKYIDRKQCVDALSKLDDVRSSYFISFVNILDDGSKFNISKIRSIQRYLDILINNSDNWDELYNEYVNSDKATRKVEIRYGKEAAVEYSATLSKKATGRKSNTWMQVDYWLKLGFSEDEAKSEIAKKQSKISINRHANTEKGSYREYNPLCIEYWLVRGYNDTIAAELLTNRKSNQFGSLQSYIEKYGEEDGTNKFNAANEKRKNTTFERHGVYSVSNNVSKSSMKVFVKLYKKLRKLGIEKDKINWGVSGSREFARSDLENKITYFYDFVVRDLKIVVEFNGLYWHPRDKESWRGRFDFDEKLKSDQTKQKFIENIGFDHFIIWEDDNFDDRIEEILKYARDKKARMDESITI